MFKDDDVTHARTTNISGAVSENQCGKFVYISLNAALEPYDPIYF